MSDEYVTVATCAQSFEAEVIRGRLESAGIEAHVQSRGWIDVFFGANFNGGRGVAVRVAEPDADRARDILDETVDVSEDDMPPIQCPSCASSDVSAEDVPSGLFTMVMEVLPGGAAPQSALAYHCEACGHKWTE